MDEALDRGSDIGRANDVAFRIEFDHARFLYGTACVASGHEVVVKLERAANRDMTKSVDDALAGENPIGGKKLL